MGFAAPLALVALLSLVIPIIVHLRRRPPRPVRVGSIRHLTESTPPLRASARLTEPWLLALRLLLLLLVSIALAEPFIRAGRPGAPRSVVVSGDTAADVWSLLRDLDDTLPAGSSIVLDVPTQVRVRGTRPALASSVEIRSTGLDPVPETPILRRTVAVDVLAPVSRRDAVRQLAAALRAVAELRGDSLEVDEVTPASARTSTGRRWIVWLGDPAPDSVLAVARGGATVIVESGGKASEGARLMVEGVEVGLRRSGEGLVYEIAGRVDDRGVREALPDVLSRLWPSDSAGTPPARITAAQLQPARLERRRTGNRASITEPLLLLAVAVFLGERILAHRSRPGSSS